MKESFYSSFLSNYTSQRSGWVPEWCEGVETNDIPQFEKGIYVSIALLSMAGSMFVALTIFY
jgi:hypothetical protein